MIEGAWLVTLHCCRQCLGRVVEKDGVYACATCGVRSHKRVEDICGCGIRPDGLGKPKTRFRCVPNPHPSASNPAEVVILFGDTPAIPVQGES